MSICHGFKCPHKRERERERERSHYVKGREFQETNIKPHVNFWPLFFVQQPNWKNVGSAILIANSDWKKEWDQLLSHALGFCTPKPKTKGMR